MCAATDPGPVLARFAVAAARRRARVASTSGRPSASRWRASRSRSSSPSRGASAPRSRGRRAQPEYLAPLEPLPDAPDEHALYAQLGIAWCPPELREAPVRRRAAAARRARRHPRRPAHAHDVVRRAGERRGDGARRDARAATTTWRSATTPPRSERSAASPPTTCAAKPRRSPPRTRSWRRFGSCAGSSATSSPTAASTCPTTSSRSSTGSKRASTAASACREAEMTRRVLEALRNPSVRCLSHPTGRYINRRPENALDLDRVFEFAVEHDIALEVNGLPLRLDLSGEHVREALRAGVKIVCSTDAHSVRGLENMQYAVARRGAAARRRPTCSTRGASNSCSGEPARSVACRSEWRNRAS